MPYRLAIFDFDGTLADSYPWFLGAVNEAADRYRFRRIDPADRERLRGHHAREVIRHVGMPMWKMPLVMRFMRRRMAQDVASIRLFPGAAELLETLATRGVPVAIVTSNSEPNVRAILGGTARFVSHFGCGASIFGKRPKLRAALAAARVPPSAALSIGDELRDLVASRAAGIAFGAVGWGFTTIEALQAHAPERVFGSMDEIAAAF